MKIGWLRVALKNLNDEAAYIAKENPPMAKNVVERIEQSVNSLNSPR